MKKTLTVNLGGTVFHIDEDAYQLLDKYLSNLRIHFRKEEGSEEIMNDFEMRISELFGERVRLGHEVITIEHVEEVINRMGKPEEIFEEEETEEEKENAKKRLFQEQVITGKKKLMRDPDNRVIGGVAAGIAAYMGWDTTAVRLAMILLLFIPFVHWMALLYIILWMVMPVARTAADRLIMRGKSVTLETIGQTVTDGFEKVSSNVNDYISSDKPRNFFQKLADLFVTVFGFLLKFGAVLAGIILLPPLLLIVFILFIVTVALVGGGASVLYQLSPFGWDLYSGVPVYMAVIGCIGVILLIGIPAIALLYAVCGQLFNLKPLPTSAKWTLLVLWLIAVAGCIIYFVNVGLPALSPYLWHNTYSIHI
ncbi:PspC domain-containing protein [Parabacteroides faecis]|uniref:PspC domain-containing protein n=1 Tax=Parabacteroides faecis TaxID=1217282 RepID=UPI002164ED54|nr:PspC domain-containing protein [Parabacteroides faecis]MCS2890929.1 PspC domain-containing protein [Parabacteroides faecis]UVQ45413.1 PspC domain-containing protein [Parabacteroides faecis]